jgi:hypothetical protein
MIIILRMASILSLVLILSPSFLAPADLPVKFQQHPDSIEVLIGGNPFTTYYFGPQSPKPYLHPLRTAMGTVVTRGFPMRTDLPGESRDHPHHRAMFFAHGDINGIDFWGEGQASMQQQTAKGKFFPTSEELPKGRTVFRQLDEVSGGADSGALRATFDLVGPDGKAIGSETQQYTFRGDASTRVIDCAFTLTANQGIPLKLGDTKEGTFAIRVVKELEKPHVKMLNSEGKVGEAEIWGKRADWVDYSGVVAGEELGIAIFDNPRNIKHPTYWHARDYGLFAVNPFGEHDFYHDPKRDGSVTIPTGGSLTLRYRVLIHHGNAQTAHVAEAYRAYTEGKGK